MSYVILVTGENSCSGPAEWSSEKKRFVTVWNGDWNVVEEGEFATEEQAVEFAEAEVGLAWTVVETANLALYQVVNRLTGKKVTTYAEALEDWPPLT